MTHVSIRALSKTYPHSPKSAVDQLSLEIPSGGLTALLGPSGCGKTTAMKMIAGLLEPTSGDITFDDRSVLRDRPEHRGAVMVFQNPLLFPYMSVADNVGFGLKMRNVAKPEIETRVAEMLALVKLPDLGRRRPAELSGGQQQRVALARALIVRPKVLLLDEPLSNLDAHLRVEMRDLIRSLQRELGMTTVFVTHDQQEAVVLADRVALILDGTLRQYDTPEMFYKRPADEAVARFFGGHNFVPGVAHGGRFQSAMGALRLPDDAPEGPGKLTFRPESVIIGGDAENSRSARIIARAFLGTQTRLRLLVNEVEIEAIVGPDLVEGFEVGAAVPVTLPRKALWVLK